MNEEIKNQIIKIENININGEGVGFLNDKKVCVKYVLNGEEISFFSKIEKDKFIFGKVDKILKQGIDRINPFCPFYTICGGCNLQHVEYKKGLDLKLKVIKEYFSDLYKNEIHIFQSDKLFNYRNKASFFVKNGKIGFLKENSNDIVEIDYCKICDDLINDSFNLVKKWLIDFKILEVNHLVVRTLNNNISLVLVVNQKPDKINELVERLENKFKGHFGLYLNFNKNKKEIMSDRFSFVSGLKTLDDEFMELKYSIHPYSFFQVNDNVKDKIYKRVVSNVENEVVVEGYSGAGILSGLLSKKAKEVYSVEINKNASQNAENLKLKNHISNLSNINGDCKDVLKVLSKKYNNATFVIDPPRSGCDQITLQALKDNRINKVIYISCNPYTLKQNIKFLSDIYYIEQLDFYDMFPFTFDLEGFCVLKRRG